MDYRIGTTILGVFIFALVGHTFISAPPEPLPFIVRGTVIWGGEAVPAAATITAYVDGEMVGAGSVDENGRYDISIPATAEIDGKPVVIRVGARALKTAVVEAGKVTNLNFDLGCIGCCDEPFRTMQGGTSSVVPKASGKIAEPKEESEIIGIDSRTNINELLDLLFSFNEVIG